MECLRSVQDQSSSMQFLFLLSLRTVLKIEQNTASLLRYKQEYYPQEITEVVSKHEASRISCNLQFKQSRLAVKRS